MESHQKDGVEARQSVAEMRERTGETSCPSGRPVDHYKRPNRKYSKQELITLLAYAEARRWSRNHKGQRAHGTIPEATERCIRQWFELVDDDGSGQLDASELEFALKASGIPANSSAIMEMIRLFDLDHDGEIAWSEFYNFLSTEVLAAKDPLGAEYVLPSGMVLPLGRMFDAIRRRKILNDIEKGGASRSFWASEGPELLRYLIESEHYSFDKHSRDLLLRILSYKPAPSKQADPDALEEHKRRVQRLKSMVLLRSTSIGRDATAGAGSSDDVRRNSSAERITTRSSTTSVSNRFTVEGCVRQGSTALQPSRDDGAVAAAAAGVEVDWQASLRSRLSFSVPAAVMITEKETEETKETAIAQWSPKRAWSRSMSPAPAGVIGRMERDTDPDNVGDNLGESVDSESGGNGKSGGQPEYQHRPAASGETVAQAAAAVRKAVECVEAMRRLDETLEQHHQRAGTAGRRRPSTAAIALASSRAGGPRYPVVIPVQDMAANMPRPPSASPSASTTVVVSPPTAQFSTRSMYSTALYGDACGGLPTESDGGNTWVTSTSASADENAAAFRAASGSAEGACARGAGRTLCPDVQSGSTTADGDGASSGCVAGAPSRRQLLPHSHQTSSYEISCGDAAAWTAAAGRFPSTALVRDGDVSGDGSGSEMASSVGGSRKCMWASSALTRRAMSWRLPGTTLEQTPSRKTLPRSSPLVLATVGSLHRSHGTSESVEAGDVLNVTHEGPAIRSTSTERLAAVDAAVISPVTSSPQGTSSPHTAFERSDTNDTIIITCEYEALHNTPSSVVDGGSSTPAKTADGTLFDGAKRVTSADSPTDLLNSSPQASFPGSSRLHAHLLEHQMSAGRGRPYSSRLIQSSRASGRKAHGGPEVSPPRPATPVAGEGASGRGSDSPCSIVDDLTDPLTPVAGDNGGSRTAGIPFQGGSGSRSCSTDSQMPTPRPEFVIQLSSPVPTLSYAPPPRAFPRQFSGRAEAAAAAAAIRRQAWNSAHNHQPSQPLQQHQSVHRLGSLQSPSAGVLSTCSAMPRPSSPSSWIDTTALSPGTWSGASGAAAVLCHMPSPTTNNNPAPVTTGSWRSMDLALQGDASPGMAAAAQEGQSELLFLPAEAIEQSRQIEGITAEVLYSRQLSGILSPLMPGMTGIARNGHSSGGGGGVSPTGNISVRPKAASSRRSFDLEPRTGTQRIATARGGVPTAALNSTAAAGRAPNFIWTRGGSNLQRTYVPSSLCKTASRTGMTTAPPAASAMAVSKANSSGGLTTLLESTEPLGTAVQLAMPVASGSTSGGDGCPSGGLGPSCADPGRAILPRPRGGTTEPLFSGNQIASPGIRCSPASPGAPGLGTHGGAQAAPSPLASTYGSAAESDGHVASRPSVSSEAHAAAAAAAEAPGGSSRAGQAAAPRRKWPWPWREDLVGAGSSRGLRPTGSGAAPTRANNASAMERRLLSFMRQA